MRNAGFRLFVLAALCCPLVVSAASAAPVAPAPRGTIAFTIGADIWTISADGTQRTPLTRKGLGREPSWSADGKRLIFAGRNGEILVMRADGSGIRSIPLPTDRRSLAGARQPVWFRDGRIAFVGQAASLPPRPRRHLRHDRERHGPAVVGVGLLSGLFPRRDEDRVHPARRPLR